jgi:hypothetical protein
MYVPDKLITNSNSNSNSNGNNKMNDTHSISESKKIQRIAILAPPGDLSGSLIHSVENIIHEYSNFVSESKRGDSTTTTTTATTIYDELYTEMELIITTHVPPYGYGKSHGYTKIIRLVPEPLLLEVTDALTAVLHPNESYNTLTLYDIQVALRQILRFHCRINHIGTYRIVIDQIYGFVSRSNWYDTTDT